MMQAEPGIPQRCSIFSGRAPQPPRPSRRWGAGAALVVLVAVLGIATPEDVQAQTVPEAPWNLRATAGHAQVVLRWAAPPPLAGGTPITKYQYRYSAVVPDDTIVIWTDWTDVPDGADADTDASNETTFTVPGLTNGTEYAFQVRAVDSVDAASDLTDDKRATPRLPRLTLTITWDEQAARSQPSFTVTFTFSEAVEGFDAEDWRSHEVFASPATEANFQMTSPTTYTIEVTPLAGEKLVNIYVSENVAQAVNRTAGNSLTIKVIPLLPRVTRTSTDATLSALALSNAADESTIDLSPAFASGPMRIYTAFVDNDVDEITITPTVNESNATVEYLDSSATAITDANPGKTGQQVSLSVDANTITVQVTAQDATTTDAYTVVVTRAAAANNAPTAADNTVTTGEDTVYTFSAASFNFSDTDSGGMLSSVRIVTLPASGKGTLALSGTTVAADKVVPAASIGNLTYTPPANANGTGYASFTFKVSDGTDESVAAYTMNINVTAGNDPATGEPAIFGTARVGRTLTVSVHGIRDVDGLPSASTFTYQWFRKVGATTTSISGANSSTYTLQTADLGNKVAVRVSFIDRGGNSEMRTSGDYPTSGTVQANNTLVSNAGQSGAASFGLDANELAQSFMTGDNADGYTLSSIELRLNSIVGGTNTPTVKLYSGSATGTEVSTLIGPAMLDASPTKNYTFRPSPTVTLLTSTTYWVVAEGTMGVSWLNTASTSEDGTSAMGWLIGDSYESRPASSTGSFTTQSGVVLQIRVNGTTGSTTAPGAPTGLTATANGPSRIDLAWAAPTSTGGSAITGYKIEVSPDGSSWTDDLVADTGSTATTYAHTGLNAATTRHYRVSAINAVGTSAASDSKEATTTAPQRLQPVALGRRSPPSTPPPPPPPGDVVGYLENPGAASFQSGLGLISGWVCDADEVEITLNGELQEAAYGTARLDTAGVCGDSDNGFGLLFNWNLLGDGEHEVVALVDGVELDRATVTVTTLGTEFLREVTGMCTVEDFPTMDETVTLAWQQTQQNFVIVDGLAPAGANQAGTPGVGYLENPGPNSFQSGIGVLSGWVCEGDEVVIELNGEPQPAAYGTERLDTLEMCGDTANGFGLLFNWNLLGEGEHEVVAYVDGEELGRATVRVTTLGAEFVRGVTGECMVEDFPMLGETVTLEWQQNSQNFVITEVEGGSTL